MKVLKPKIIIENISRWPDSFVNVIIDWVLEQAKIDWSINVIIKNHKSWSGNGSIYKLIIRMNRRYKPGGFPWKHKDHRYKWSPEFEFKSRIEVFVFLLAHEAFHSVKANDGKKEKKCEEEFFCDDFAFRIVKKFRIEWYNLKEKIKKQFRKELNVKKREIKNLKKKTIQKEELKKKQIGRKTEKRTPEYKLKKFTMLLNKWEKKQKVSNEKVKFYRAKVKHFQQKINN